MYELRSAPGKIAIKVTDYEEVQAMRFLCQMAYKREIIITPDEVPDTFDMGLYKLYYDKHLMSTIINGKLTMRLSVDVIILGKDLANFESVDYPTMLQPYITDNEALVIQFKNGNVKALNALMGKFLKDHRGHDPQKIKEQLTIMLA